MENGETSARRSDDADRIDQRFAEWTKSADKVGWKLWRIPSPIRDRVLLWELGREVINEQISVAEDVLSTRLGLLLLAYSNKCWFDLKKDEQTKVLCSLDSFGFNRAVVVIPMGLDAGEEEKLRARRKPRSRTLLNDARATLLADNSRRFEVIVDFDKGEPAAMKEFVNALDDYRACFSIRKQSRRGTKTGSPDTTLRHLAMFRFRRLQRARHKTIDQIVSKWNESVPRNWQISTVADGNKYMRDAGSDVREAVRAIFRRQCPLI